MTESVAPVVPASRRSGRLIGLLDHAATRYPDRPAIVHGDRRWSYAELADRADGLAGALAAAGVRPGDPVALLLDDAPEWVAALFAVLRAGGVAVPLNQRFKRPELEFCCRDAGVRALVADERSADAGRALARRLGRDVPLVRADGAPPRGVAGFESAVVSSDAVAVVHHSPGATGRPKRVPRTHAALAAEAASVADGLGIHPDDRILCAIPLFHAYGLGCCLLAAVGSGATLVLADASPLPLRRERVLSTVQRERVTVFPAVPFALRLLAEAGGGSDLSSLRLCLSAATALPRSTFDAFDAAFGIPIRQLYGCTETGAIAVNLDADPYATAATVGRPLPGVELRVLDELGADVEPGRIGELAIRSPGMTTGYAGRDELNRVAFRDGLFRSGDRGRLDEAGRLRITGRAKLLIDVRGSDKVDPLEVEDVLAVHPQVREVVVVGTPSGVEGEELVKAVVVAEGGCAERELVRYCRERLADSKVPRQVEFADEIPRGPGGTVLRKYLV